MTAEIIHLPVIRVERDLAENVGIGARDAVGQYFADCGEPLLLFLPREDHFLAWLWEHGFKVVPVVE